jgi:quinol monooxygenase YgiN
MARQGKVVAIYEAELLPEQGAALRQAYAALARGLPSEVTQTYLVPPRAGRTAWHLMVTWRSRAAFEAHRDAELLPGFALSGTRGE